MKTLKCVLFSILSVCGLQCGAQTVSNCAQYILTQTIDNETHLYPFSNTSKFTVLPDETFVINNLESQNSEIDLKNLSAFGIISDDSLSSIPIDIISNNMSDQWSIFSISGTLLLSGSEGPIPYGSLQKGHVYIIKLRNNTYKYISLWKGSWFIL